MSKLMKKEKINFHKLSQEIAKEEGKKEEVNIAQIKEILSITCKKLSKYHYSSVMEFIHRISQK